MSMHIALQIYKRHLVGTQASTYGLKKTTLSKSTEGT